MLALLSAGILLASCKKDKNDEPTPSSSVTTNTTQVTPDNNPQNPDNGDNNQQNPDETIFVSDITLDKNSVTLKIEEAVTLVATVSPENATDKTVTWESSKPEVATVDENGKIIAKSVGETTITAKAGDKTAECKVIVAAKTETLTLTVNFDGDASYLFSQDDVDNQLAITIKNGDISLGTLTLQDTDGNFSGELTTAPSNEGAELTAAIILNEGSEISSSTESIADLIKKCVHNYTGTFKYKTDEQVTLTDDRAYIEFTLAEGQKKVSVNGQWYDVDQTSHKAYVAVEGNTEVTTRIKGKETLPASKIYTIECTDVVDLGLSVLWCTSNATSSEADQKTWEEAKTLAASKTGYDLPFADNFRELIGEKTVDGVTVSKTEKWDGTGVENGYTFSTDYGSVFFPAAGLYGGSNAGNRGFFWSGESSDDDNAYILRFFDDGNAYVGATGVFNKYSVRLVRVL